jgi:hypothetical protein
MKRLIFTILVLLCWVGSAVAETLGSEIATGTLTYQTPYVITATEADHFFTGGIVGDYFVSLGIETCNANNKVQELLSFDSLSGIGGVGVFIGDRP